MAPDQSSGVFVLIDVVPQLDNVRTLEHPAPIEAASAKGDLPGASILRKAAARYTQRLAGLLALIESVQCNLWLCACHSVIAPDLNNDERMPAGEL